MNSKELSYIWPLTRQAIPPAPTSSATVGMFFHKIGLLDQEPRFGRLVIVYAFHDGALKYTSTECVSLRRGWMLVLSRHNRRYSLSNACAQTMVFSMRGVRVGCCSSVGNP